MVKVAAHWEYGYMTPMEEAYFWNLALRDFEVKDWYMTPVTGIKHNEHQKVNLKEFHDYEGIIQDAGEDLTRVFIEPRTKHQTPITTWLHEFEHPEDCIYIFGSAHFNPTLFHKREDDVVVSIKTVQDRGVFWSNQCMCIVLYDRLVKSK